ncbi:energy-coupling factor ABC transporter permease [Vibrio japonicus]|uniref:Energy-coupling factor ABC transporter permease n=1 Tax=Vibrio japonicus TaxID=1824638 RepID=A0ABY5LKU0_9VIBR|nr:energy-coupling factor ABC transporter permease [Vibrio japonicus]UUM31536.1 energy-coupling factor ABC transporter permease [Vibrio japonicus]
MLLNQLFAFVIVLGSLGFIWRDVAQVLLPKLRAERAFQHLTFAVIFALTVLWSAQAGVKEGLSIHFLALTTLALMYGWRSAYAISIVVSLTLCLTGTLSLSQVPEYLIFSCLLPIGTSYIVFLLSYRFLPRNIFVFIFVAGFFNGAITGSFHLLTNSVYHVILDTYDWTTIVDNYLVFVPLLAFPEGLLNGMSLAMFSVFKPEWLRVFSDRDYIYNHYHKK